MRKLMLIGILLSFFLGSTVYAFPPRPIPPVYRGELIVDGVNFTFTKRITTPEKKRQQYSY